MAPSGSWMGPSRRPGVAGRVPGSITTAPRRRATLRPMSSRWPVTWASTRWWYDDHHVATRGAGLAARAARRRPVPGLRGDPDGRTGRVGRRDGRVARAVPRRLHLHRTPRGPVRGTHRDAPWSGR